jgi:hypothetical protein
MRWKHLRVAVVFWSTALSNACAGPPESPRVREAAVDSAASVLPGNGRVSARTSAASPTRYAFRIHPARPVYGFSLFRVDPYTIDSVQVYRGAEYVQTIARDIQTEGRATDLPPVGVADINFDGFADLRLLSSVGNTGNEVLEWWLFDSRTERFVHSESASGVIGNYELDSRRRTVTTTWGGGRMGTIFKRTTYSWSGDKLVTLRMVEQSWDQETGLYRRITRTLRNGGLAVVADSTFNESQL